MKCLNALHFMGETGGEAPSHVPSHAPIVKFIVNQVIVEAAAAAHV